MARAPIHPKRPYGLTRPVVPPDGSFVFGDAFAQRPVRDVAVAAALATSQHSHAGASLDCRQAGKPRISTASCRRSIPGRDDSLDKIKVFHKISLSRLIDSYPLRPRPFFSSRVTGWFMTHRLDVARGRDVVARWCTLAERRLEYLTELFETGRWRRFHSERDFLENIQEAKAAVETWRDLLSREASRDNTAIDVSWLGRARTALPRDEGWRGPVHLRRPILAEISVEPPQSMQSRIRPGIRNGWCGGCAFRAGDRRRHQPGLTPDIAAIAERYPLLRNAL